MTTYVVGFLWHHDSVVLIRKNKPAWQAGKWNGVGGKIEPGETPLAAMVREFEEETGWHEEGWQHFCTNIGPDYEVYFFVSESVERPYIRSMTDEMVSRFRLDHVCNTDGPQVIPNLVWLLPMSRFAWDNRGESFKAVITEQLSFVPPEVEV